MTFLKDFFPALEHSKPATSVPGFTGSMARSAVEPAIPQLVDQLTNSFSVVETNPVISTGGNIAREVTALNKSTVTTERKKTPLNQGNPFALVPVDLSSSLLTGVGLSVNTPGHQLLYRREGSTPNGRLNINLGGQVTDFYPGARIKGFFEKFDILRSSRSVVSGTANLIIIGSDEADFIEPETTIPGDSGGGVDLLGSSTTPTFVTLPKDTAPSGAPSGIASSFIVTGWNKVRVLIDGGASNTLTTMDVIPWLYDSNVGQWFEQGTEAVSIPDSIATAQRYRVFVLNTVGVGYLYLEIRNALPASVAPKAIVQGIN